MTRKPQINAPEPHVVVSHGADFTGEDRHPLKVLASLAGYAEGCLPSAERGPLVLLLTNPGDGGCMSPAQAAEISQLLLRLARHRFVKASAAAHARSLADAAARAAADGERWEWWIAA
ncbi:DUF7739 domain-containing protein [Streptomyces prunicolor]|uniref:DUF7739 domain-containing protein n=1 Tax=Streptomyces prunicolor TaxID=67348 RepID=A0ABU4FQ51_9ACTN|nr:hypothetical protein [Streptomyces prunicolor]MDV7222748.1 hypothetical protein [Streptomyces prunicolor]